MFGHRFRPSLQFDLSTEIICRITNISRESTFCLIGNVLMINHMILSFFLFLCCLDIIAKVVRYVNCYSFCINIYGHLAILKMYQLNHIRVITTSIISKPKISLILPIVCSEIPQLGKMNLSLNISMLHLRSIILILLKYSVQKYIRKIYTFF